MHDGRDYPFWRIEGPRVDHCEMTELIWLNTLHFLAIITVGDDMELRTETKTTIETFSQGRRNRGYGPTPGQ